MTRVSVLVVLILGHVATAACKSEAPTDRVRVSGFAEATEVRVAGEVGGRILELLVDEGSRVDDGQVLVRLDTSDAQLALQRARAERDQATAQLRLLEAGSRVEEIRQAEAQAAAARSEVAGAEAELSAAEADFKRFDDLVRANAGARKPRDDAETQRRVAVERVQAAKERVQGAEEVVRRLRAGPRRQEIDGARARVAATDAEIARLEKDVTDAVVYAPASGVISERLVEKGEIVAARTPLFVVVDIDRAWATVYVDEPIVPRLRLGQPASIFTDAGGPGLPGEITYISPQAEFTPRNVQTAEERSKLVFRIKVTIDNREGILKPGMPVEAELPFTGQG